MPGFSDYFTQIAYAIFAPKNRSGNGRKARYDYEYRRNGVANIFIIFEPLAGKTAWTPKDKDMRVVPLARGTMNILTQLQSAANDGQAYIFVNSKGPSRGMPVKGQNTWRDFQVIRRRAGLPKFSIHDLRKGYCTNLSAAIPMHVVKELAGHSDIRTTQKYYLKVQPELIEKARKDIELSVTESESN